MSSSGTNTKNASGWEGGSSADVEQVDGIGAAGRSNEVSGEGGAPLAMSLTSDEVNYLVFRYVVCWVCGLCYCVAFVCLAYLPLFVLLSNRYLQESGFVHSAFTFVYESMLGKTNIRNGDRSIPPGALISFLQKGLQYVGIEESLHRDSKKGQRGNKVETGVAEEADFTLLSQPATAALTRTHPSILLNLPPAAAAAAVKARLETEAKLASAREDRERQALSDQMSSNASGSALADSASLTQHRQQQQLMDQASIPAALHAQDALAAQAAAVQAVAGAQDIGISTFAGHVQQSGLTAMQMALQQQQDEQLRTEAEAQGLLALSPPSLAAGKAGKRNNAEKRSIKKNKASKKAQQQQQQHYTAADSNPLHLMSQASAAVATTPGLSSLEEAVARLEASQDGEKNTVQPMDVDEGNNLSQIDSTKASTRQELLNGQHPGYNSNGSGPASGNDQSMQPVNGKTAGMHGAERQPPNSAPTANQKEQPLICHADSDAGSADDKIDKEDRLSNAPASEVLELRMHSSEVFMCAWNPVFTSFIATGSGDASARIWQMGGADAAAGLGPVRLLPHGEDPRDKKNKDVTTLEWSFDGKLLATGSYDGVARVWSRSGALLHTLRGHKGPIFSLKWNKRGNFLLSGSYDKTTIVWDVSGSTGFVEQQFNDHQAPALDVDWKDDTTFASCSTDKTVNICKVGVSRPLKTFCGHTDEVNAVKWDPSGTLLASCSDDCTAKVWDVSSDLTGPLQDFTSHRQEIYTVKW